MAARSNSSKNKHKHYLLNAFSEYEKKTTTKKRVIEDEEYIYRYENDRFISRFSALLGHIISGDIIENTPSSTKGGKTLQKSISLKPASSPPFGFTEEMYTIWGRTNKKIVRHFLDCRKSHREHSMTEEEIEDYINQAYVKKRKYEADSTLEELIDFLNFTGDPIETILPIKNNIEYSIIQLISPDDIANLDEMKITKTLRLPALSIPSLGIQVTIIIETRSGRLPSVSAFSDPYSNYIYSFDCSDTLSSLNLNSKSKSIFRESFCEYQKSSIENIKLKFRDVVASLMEESSFTSPEVLFERIFDKNAEDRENEDFVWRTAWYKEYQTFLHRLKKTNCNDTTKNSSTTQTKKPLDQQIGEK